MADPPANGDAHPQDAEMAANTETAIVVSTAAPTSASNALVAVSDVRLAGVDLNEIKKIATMTKAVGVIMPPPDIRAIVDKTASFVAKHGPEFEKRILANEKNNVKFNFLVPTDPYHAYYQLRIKNFSDGKDGEAAKDQAGAAAAAAELGKAGAPAPQVIPHALAKLEKPEDEMYTVHVPEGLSLLELDMIKLTAQFVARNGKNFLTGLSSREHTNPQFSFLKPTHSLFGFFTSLCDAYSRVLMPPKGTRDRLQKDATDSAAVLERALKRLEWEKVKEREMQDAADEAERERQAYQAVDWHEFVVVETIDFYDDEDDELPPPLTLKDIVMATKAHAFMVDEPAAAEEAAAPAPVMTEEERQLVAQAAAVTLAPQGQTAAAAAAATTGVTAAPEPEIEEAEMEVDDDEGPIKVVKNYVRPQAQAAMAGRQAYDPTKFAVSPITGELVPVSEMAEHMRISLIDPRWKEQREAMLSKIRENTRAQDDEIGRNLINLASTRPDIFGSTEEEVTQVVSESIREKLISGTQRAVAWDGVTQKGPELQNQIAAIQQNRASMAAAGGGGPGQGPGGIRPPGMNMPGPPGLPPGMMPPGPPGMRPPGMMPPGHPGMLPPPPSIPRPPGGPPGMPPGPPQTMGIVAAARAAQQQAMAAGGTQGGLPPPPSISQMKAGGLGGPPPGPPGGMPRPPMPGGMPPPPGPGLPREAPPPMPGDQPEAKRQRVADIFVLQPEEEFLAKYSGSSKVRVQCPEVEGNEKLTGQLLEVEVASLQDTVGEFKERLSGVVGIGPKQIKLTREGVGFLRDDPTLAFYNVGPDVTLTLGVQTRARGKKQ